MIKSPDPSRSLNLLIEHLDDQFLDYDYDSLYLNSPVTGQTELSSLCYDVMNSDEYDRPVDTVGFTITQGEINWKTL